MQLPPFIPSRTNEIGYLGRRYHWAAIDLRYLLTRHTSSPPHPRPYLCGSQELRSFAKCADRTRIIAVLNGTDDLLEGFWGGDRDTLYTALISSSVSLVTGPTFSVTAEINTPASHNVMMMQRHHRVVEELQEHGLTPIPNLYWRGSPDRERWIAWLAANDTIRIIGRDFSRTKATSSFRREFEGLLEILEVHGRPLHVVMTGVGPKNAPLAFDGLRSVNCRATLVSSYPILTAIKHGRQIQLGENSQLTLAQCPDLDRFSLAIRNLQTMDDYIRGLARSDHGRHVWPPPRYEEVGSIGV